MKLKAKVEITEDSLEDYLNYLQGDFKEEMDALLLLISEELKSVVHPPEEEEPNYDESIGGLAYETGYLAKSGTIELVSTGELAELTYTGSGNPKSNRERRMEALDYVYAQDKDTVGKSNLYTWDYAFYQEWGGKVGKKTIKGWHYMGVGLQDLEKSGQVEELTLAEYMKVLRRGR